MRTGRPNYSVKASGWWTRWRGWRAQDWWSSGGRELEQSINPSWGALGDCAAAVLCVPIHQLQRLPPLLWESDQPWAKQARLSQLHGAPKHLTLCSSCALALAPHQAKIVSAACWASREILGCFLFFFFHPDWVILPLLRIPLYLWGFGIHLISSTDLTLRTSLANPHLVLWLSLVPQTSRNWNCGACWCKARFVSHCKEHGAFRLKLFFSFLGYGFLYVWCWNCHPPFP